MFDGQSVASVARELGISEGLLHNWKKARFVVSSDVEQENIALQKRLRFGRDGARYPKKGGTYLQPQAVSALRLYPAGTGEFSLGAVVSGAASQSKCVCGLGDGEDGLCESVEQARAESFDYIEAYYKRSRKHSSLGYKSPLEFEQELKIKEKGQRMSFVS